jgi:hypothetical protein
VTGEQFLSVPGMRHGEFYDRASELFNGRFSREDGMEVVALAPYTLTTPGDIVADAALDAVWEREIEAEPEDNS